jgi:hypothetical protein
MLRLSHSSWFDHPNNILWRVPSWSSLLCSFLHSPVTSSLLVPNTYRSTLLSNKLHTVTVIKAKHFSKDTPCVPPQLYGLLQACRYLAGGLL